MTKKEQKQKGLELGKSAFHKGINAPVLDPKVQIVINESSRVPGSLIEFLKAWNKGWMIENINAPI